MGKTLDEVKGIKKDFPSFKICFDQHNGYSINKITDYMTYIPTPRKIIQSKCKMCLS